MKQNYMYISCFFLFSIFLGLASFPQAALAHEVYVLDQPEIFLGIQIPAFDMLDVVHDNLPVFALATVIGLAVVLCVFYLSTRSWLLSLLGSFFQKTKKYTALIGRITIGLSFIAGAYFHAAYGPELPLVNIYGSLTGVATWVLGIVGVCIVLGFRVRAVALIALAMYLIESRFLGIYMLTYINYLGELILLLTLGASVSDTRWSVDSWLVRKGFVSVWQNTWLKKVSDFLAPRSYAITRVCFGVGLIYASSFAKIIHNNLALETVYKFGLDKIFGFEAHFLVLGAALIEIAIGLMFILGLEIRFTSIFFLTFLTMSLCFFGEAVWPHIMLLGLPVTFILYGYDRYSLEGWFFRNKGYEPVL